jgi:hypothetical protein
MARRSEESRYEEWSSLIHEREVALRSRIVDWDRYLRHYRMDLTPEEVPPDDSVWLNLFFTFSRIILPSIYYRNPDIIVSPLRDTPLTYATLLEKLLNWQFRKMRFEREGRKVCFDALFCDLGVVKLGYGPALQGQARSRMDQEEFFEEASAFADELEEASEEKPMGWEPDERLTGWNPFAVRISPKLFLIDKLATSLDDARWVDHLVIKTVDQVKNSKLYPKGLTRGIEGHMNPLGQAALNEVSGGQHGHRYGGGDRLRSSEPGELVILHEIWDRERDKLMVLDSYNMAHGNRRFLREENAPYDIEGFPFEVLVFNQDTESPYGVSDAATWYNPMMATNLLNSMQYNHVKRFNRKYFVDKGLLDDDEMAKFESPYDGAVVRTNGPMAGRYEAVQDASVTPDLYGLRDVLRNELTAASGVTEQRKGGGEKAHTATEASLIDQQARLRDSDRLYEVADLVQRVASKILILDRQFLDINKVDFVVGPELSRLWTKVADDVLKSEVDVRVRVGSSGFMSREVRTKQLIDLLNVGKDSVDDTGQRVLNVRAFIERIAEQMDVDDYRALINPPMPGMGMMGMGMPPNAGGQQQPNLRTGAPNLGNMLSGVQNLGVRRTPPNPTNAGWGKS